MKFDKENNGGGNDEQEKGKGTEYILNYTVKYAGREHSWFERNCQYLHKGKKLAIEYMIGFEDQSLEVTVVAKSLEVIQERFDTYNTYSDLNIDSAPPNTSLQT